MGYRVALMADSLSRWARGAARDRRPPAGDAGRGGLSHLPREPAGQVLRARRAGPCPRPARAHRRAHADQRGLAAGRRFLRAGHPGLAARGRRAVGARPGAGPPAAVPGGRLGDQLLAVRRTDRAVVRGARRARTGRRSAARPSSCCSGSGSCGRSPAWSGPEALQDTRPAAARGGAPGPRDGAGPERLRPERRLLAGGQDLPARPAGATRPIAPGSAALDAGRRLRAPRTSARSADALSAIRWRRPTELDSLVGAGGAGGAVRLSSAGAAA